MAFAGKFIAGTVLLLGGCWIAASAYANSPQAKAEAKAEASAAQAAQVAEANAHRFDPVTEVVDVTPTLADYGVNIYCQKTTTPSRTGGSPSVHYTVVPGTNYTTAEFTTCGLQDEDANEAPKPRASPLQTAENSSAHRDDGDDAPTASGASAEHAISTAADAAPDQAVNETSPAAEVASDAKAAQGSEKTDD